MHQNTLGVWVYTDTLQEVSSASRPCGYCGLASTKEGYDGCIGELKDVMNACCGHGEMRMAYVQFNDSKRISGYVAISYMKKRVLKVCQTFLS